MWKLQQKKVMKTGLLLVVMHDVTNVTRGTLAWFAVVYAHINKILSELAG